MMLISRRHMMFGLAVAGVGLAQPASAKGHIITGLAFGSGWRMEVESIEEMHTANSVIKRIVADVDQEMSPYKNTSALSQFNAARTTDWQPMPAAMCTVAIKALRIADLSNSAFDPTVGPLVSRFGFGPIKGGAGLYKDINVKPNSIKKNTSDLTLDFCGIAKGYALDLVASELARLGLRNAIIEIGGEVATLGRHPDGRPWQVGIVDPNSSDFAVRHIVEPRGLALATSGHSANGISGPISSSHIIDPRIGRPAATTLASVSVLASTAMEADALATALCAAGLGTGVTLAKRLGVSALFIADNSQAENAVMTGKFDAHIVA